MVIVLLTKLKNTNYSDDENNTGDNIDEVPSFFIGLIIGNNIDITEGDDVAKNIYMQDDHFEGI